MLSSEKFVLSQVVSSAVLDKLYQVQRDMAQELGAIALWVTEHDLAPSWNHELNIDRVSLVVSPSFSALLVGRGGASTHEAQPTNGLNNWDCYSIHLAFDPATIAAVLDAWIAELPADHELLYDLKEQRTQLGANDPTLQSQFTLRLIQAIAQEPAIAPGRAPIVRKEGPERTPLTMAELLQQNVALEKQIRDRTQDLHDAIVAAEAASRTKNEFIAAMSHELRTPLTAIIGMSATLMRWSTKELSDRQRSFLQTIHDSGQHLLTIINDILDMSQFESGKTVLQLSEFSLSLMAQQALKSVEDAAEQHGVELQLDVQVASSRDRFVADPYRVRQVLLNLLSNAVKFTPDGGRVTLRVFADPNSVIFQVKDTGIGIAEHKRSLLFQKFQQLDGSYQRAYEGTGLGLALTKQLVELHGGRITVDSTVGVGSIFTVYLPVRQVAAHEVLPNVELEVHSGATQGRIVLIENHEESANIICDMLTAAGYQVVWMLDGTMAMSQIEMLQPAAVIADIEDAGSDGYEFIRHLRQNPTTKKLKVIAIAPNSLEDTQARCKESGADECLVKPISPEQILPKVLALITQESLAQS